jgi:hypothetical protein
MDVEDDRAQYAAQRTIQRTAQRGSQQQYDPPRATRAEPDVQDGRWGFSDTPGSSEPSYREDLPKNRHNARGRRGPSGGLVSDGMLRRDNSNSNGYYRR